jgi:hypothetical protein
MSRSARTGTTQASRLSAVTDTVLIDPTIPPGTMNSNSSGKERAERTERAE